VLGDLPILGYLFKYKTIQKKRTELIILITPRIVEE
jgi:type II secretory pathway component GspD/PulD (secretin)